MPKKEQRSFGDAVANSYERLNKNGQTTGLKEELCMPTSTINDQFH